tara:strand:- start:1300 stop:2391 length:1092 start_codon:yes stop_codon:yes gene_type:complete
MAWALQLDGVNDFLKSAVAISNPVPVGESLIFNGLWENTGGALQMPVDIYSGGSNDYVALLPSGQIRSRFSGNTLTSGDAVIDGAAFKLEIVRTISEYSVYLDDVFQYSHSIVADLNDFTGFSDGFAFKGQIRDCAVGSVAFFDATASSHAAGTPILTDTIGGNNATGVNMPTDGSAWVDLGGSGISITTDFDVRYSIESSLVSVTTDFDIRYSMLNELTTDFDIRYSMLNSVTTDFDIRYSMLNELTTDFDIRYSMLNSVTTDFDIRYSMLNELTTDFDIRYSIAVNLVTVTTDFDVRYMMLNSVTTDFDIRYAMFNEVTTDFDVRYNINGDSVTATNNNTYAFNLSQKEYNFNVILREFNV